MRERERGGGGENFGNCWSEFVKSSISAEAEACCLTLNYREPKIIIFFNILLHFNEKRFNLLYTIPNALPQSINQMYNQHETIRFCFKILR